MDYYSSEKQKDKEVTCFIDCVALGGLAEKVVQPYLNKGSQVYIIGRLKLDQWTDQNGGKRSKHAVTVDTMKMLGSKDDNQSNNGQANQTPSQGHPQQDQQPPTQTYQANPQGYQQSNPQQGNMPDNDFDDDEIPF